MKYNFKVGEKVQIYRKPVDGLGVDISELPGVGSIGSVIDYDDGERNEYDGIPYVRIKFNYDNLNNCKNPDTRYWAIPCSCLKRVKEVKLIKVSADKDSDGSANCISVSGKLCYFWNHDCDLSNRFPACSKEEIIWLKSEQ